MPGHRPSTGLAGLGRQQRWRRQSKEQPMTDHPGRLPDLLDPIPADMAQSFLDADGIVQFMRLHNIEVTRENYIALGFDEGTPWCEEFEQALPPPLQDWSQFGQA
jgi:hypothetical protein